MKTVKVTSKIGNTKVTSVIEYEPLSENKEFYDENVRLFGNVLERLVFETASHLAEKMLIEGAKALEKKKLLKQ